MKTKRCDNPNCNEENRLRNLKRINGNVFCKKCYKKRMESKRKKLEKEINLNGKEKEMVKEMKDNLEKKEIENRKKSQKKYWKKRSLYTKLKRGLEDIKHGRITEWKPKSENPPKIKGSKIKKVSKNFHKYLTREEKQLLFKKYIKKGLSYEEADKKVKRDVKYLEELRNNLKENKKLEEELNKNFKEEFAKLLESEE